MSIDRLDYSFQAKAPQRHAVEGGGSDTTLQDAAEGGGSGANSINSDSEGAGAGAGQGQQGQQGQGGARRQTYSRPVSPSQAGAGTGAGTGEVTGPVKVNAAFAETDLGSTQMLQTQTSTSSA